VGFFGSVTEKVGRLTQKETHSTARDGNSSFQMAKQVLVRVFEKDLEEARGGRFRVDGRRFTRIGKARV